MSVRKPLKLSREEIAQSWEVGGWAAKYPPVLTIGQAAELLQIPKETLYQWRSQGKLTGCCQRTGKHLRFFRDRLVLKIMNEGV